MISKIKKPLSLLIPMLFPLVLAIIVLFIVPQKAEARKDSNGNTKHKILNVNINSRHDGFNND